MIVAMGTEANMKNIRQLEADDDQEEAPPKKKAYVGKASKGRKWLGKENRNQPPSQQHRNGRNGALSLWQLSNWSQENTRIPPAAPG
ncbi:MAG: hypothetical protein MJE68_01570, partial [Proteobacteria bacterium]|nr:hypothetical protein [Pseudomonadota bacterium]